MSKQRSRVRLTPTEARGKYMERAEELWDDFNAWYQANPEATFDEIETELGQRRRELVGEVIELSLRQGDLGAEPEAARCERCGKPMAFQGYREKAVHGLQADVHIRRAYYYCSTCRVGLFPPGPTSGAEAG